MPITENTWILLTTFIFLILLGFRRKDPVIEAISGLSGIFLMIQVFDSNVYLAIIIMGVSIYLLYYAILVEWRDKK